MRPIKETLNIIRSFDVMLNAKQKKKITSHINIKRNDIYTTTLS